MYIFVDNINIVSAPLALQDMCASAKSAAFSLCLHVPCSDRFKIAQRIQIHSLPQWCYANYGDTS